MTNKKKEKVTAEKVDDDDNIGDEPSWYHYVIIVIGVVGVFALISFGVSLYDDSQMINESGIENNNTIFYKYDTKIGETTYHLNFRTHPDELENIEFYIEPTKADVLNTKDFIFSFMEYNGTDNGEVVKGSSMLLVTLKKVYGYGIGSENIVLFNETNCSSSTIDYKVVVFNPYSNETGVFIDEATGCIEFNTQVPTDMPVLVDKFIYELVQE